MNKNTIGLMKGIGTGLAAGMMVGYVGSPADEQSKAGQEEGQQGRPRGG
ncbi:MAG: hypothetical protein ACLT1K_07130 [[Clostridium] leptum]